MKKLTNYTPPKEIKSLHQWELYQRWEDQIHDSYEFDSLIEELDIKINVKKRSTDEQPLNYNHTNPFDELDKSLGNNPDSTSGKDKKKNRFEHLEIETDGTDNSEGDGGAPTK